MKRIYTLGLTVSCLILFTKVSFAQTSHSVLVGPGGQFVFEPVNLTISTGDTVIWEWQSNNHSTTSDSTSGVEVWNSGIRNNGATFSKVFITLGTYPYHCTPHQALGMVGTITVQNVAVGLAFRVERTTGNVFADGSFIPSGADLAERINVSEPVEPGDVVEFDPTKPGQYRKARGQSQLIAGVITTKPGFTLGNNPEEMEQAGEKAAGRPMLALMGRVPVKAITENGPIRPGDLLTVASKPGYAMRCAEAKDCNGAIIGKALQGLEKGEGMILVLVMSH